MEWSAGTLCLGIFITSLGSVVQATTGLGGGILIVPLLALISYELVPGPMALASMVLTVTMAVRGRREIAWQGLGVMCIGLGLGTVLGVLFLSQLSLVLLGFVFSFFIVVAVLISVFGQRLEVHPTSQFITGMSSGLMGAASGMGAPILALLYQYHSGPALRATLAVLFAFSTAIMIIGFYLSGHFQSHHWLAALYLSPGFLIGYFVSPYLIAYVDKGYARSLVLVISLSGAAVLFYQSASALLK